MPTTGKPADCRPRPPGLAPVLAAVALLAWFPPTLTAAGVDTPKLVVVLHVNESDGAPGVALADRAIRATFAAESPVRVDVRNEYVDTSRLTDPEFRRAQVALLRKKYAGRKVDLVMTGLSSGLDFALEHRDELFPGVPVVYIAVEEREVKARALPPDVVGSPIRMDLTGTLDLALSLHPHTERVFVVAGKAPFDAYWEAEARRVFAPYTGRVEFVYLTGLPMPELLARVSALPARSLVYYLHIFQDGAGATIIPAEGLERIAAVANAPIYGHVDTYVGRGAVGGRVFGFEAEGRKAARLGLRLLAGERPEAVSVPAADGNEFLFDWRQLRRWGIDEKALPPGSAVRYREQTFWDEYRWHVVGAGSVCLVQSLLIVGLVVQRVKRRRADERFRQVIETAPAGMLMVGRDGTIVLANAQAERLFGYPRAELLGRPVETLLPERLRASQAADRERFFASPAVRPMGAGLALSGRRQDGTEFPIEVGLSPVRTAEGLFLLASVVDLTERRRAEDGLRASRRELQVLARRLLAAQEDERRRIARELHDDVNQALALVALEMDLLARPGSGIDTRTLERARALSARVKELSSAVHDLSHQLHPAKLEQLGLVAAIGGLCRELGRHHGLTVEFTHHGVPRTIPEATAVCLYRIAQEALRNVVKHGRTDRAAVELRGSPDAIRLRVRDDGAGFDPASPRCRGGLGLVSMRERLSLVGGEIGIDSRPGGGTRIEVRVPAPDLEPPRLADPAREPEPAEG